MTESESTNLPATIPENGFEAPPGMLAARTKEQFDLAARKIGQLVHADILPATYRNQGNLMIALDISERTGIPLLAVCQNLHIIKGKPGWGSPFMIAAINQCGKFSRLRFHLSGEGDDHGCHCTATDLGDGEFLEGTRITIGDAKQAGWWGRKDSLWKVIPDQMLRYRAAAFWCRVHAPEISQGLMTTEEIHDIRPRSDRSAEVRELVDSEIPAAGVPIPAEKEDTREAPLEIEAGDDDDLPPDGELFAEPVGAPKTSMDPDLYREP